MEKQQSVPLEVPNSSQLNVTSCSEKEVALYFVFLHAVDTGSARKVVH